MGGISAASNTAHLSSRYPLCSLLSRTGVSDLKLGRDGVVENGTRRFVALDKNGCIKTQLFLRGIVTDAEKLGLVLPVTISSSIP